MALTVNKVAVRGRTMPGVPGDHRVVYRDITFDSSYPTTGLALPSAASLGLKEILFVEVESGMAYNSAGTLAIGVRFNRATQKLQAYGSNGAAPAQFAEIANTTNLSAFTCRVRFEGLMAS